SRCRREGIGVPRRYSNRRSCRPAWLRKQSGDAPRVAERGMAAEPGRKAGEKDMNDNGLTHYLEEARRFPMLSPERELELSLGWRDKRDREALRQLVGSHL